MRLAGKILSIGVLAAVVLFAQAPSEGAPISPGNLVIVRAGDGAAALSLNATAAFLDEYTTAGGLVQSIPVSGLGASALTLSGLATTEGILGRSQDGNSLVFAGYRKDVGGTNPSADSGAVTNRVVGMVGMSGLVTTTTAITDPTGSARSATTTDGSIFYYGTSTGVRYIASPSDTTSTVIDTRNSRQAVVTGNTLFASNGSTAVTAKVQSYGTLPTVATVPTPVVTLTTADAVNGIFFCDLNAGVAGDDTLYLMSTVENLLRKYTFDGVSWTSNGSIAGGGASNLTGFVSGSSVSLFLTSGSGLFPFTDASGVGGALSGALGASIASPGTNTAFRGISAFIPEPSALGIVAIALAGFLPRRRHSR